MGRQGKKRKRASGDIRALTKMIVWRKEKTDESLKRLGMEGKKKWEEKCEFRIWGRGGVTRRRHSKEDSLGC
jgi:hypothetical protein